MEKIIENELKTLVKILLLMEIERPHIAIQRLGLEIAPYQKRPVDLLVENVFHFETQKN